MTYSIHVVAGVVRDHDGRVLIAERPVGKHQAGSWEFPGGKLRHGEDSRSGLQRELREELGIEVRSCSPLIRFAHCYPDRTVDLEVYEVDYYDGIAVGLEGQQLRWIDPAELAEVNLLPADKPIVVALRLPSLYIITPPQLRSVQQLADQLHKQPQALLQLRLPQAGHDQMVAIATQLASRGVMHRVMLNGEPRNTQQLAGELGAAGIHVPARYLATLERRGFSGWVAASCHNAAELHSARQQGADFAVLGPVQRTRSHPELSPLGWSEFARLVGSAGLPVYALGGVTPGEVALARRHGARGVAGISAFWRD